MSYAGAGYARTGYASGDRLIGGSTPPTKVIIPTQLFIRNGDMALYGVSFVATYVAWDTVNNVGKTGDVANHTLRWVKDGTSSAPTNTPTEVDSVNAPGLCKVILTATEASCVCGIISGKSSSTGISLMPVTFTFEQLPNITPGANGGLPVLDSNLEVKASTLRTNNDKTGYSLTAAAIQSIYDYSTTLLTTLNSIGKLFVDNINATISSRLPTTSYVTPLDGAGTRGALGLANADLDTQLSNIPNSILDQANGVGSGWTLRMAMRVIAASAGGTRSGFDTNSPAIASIDGSKTRISSSNATVDGNATVVADGT